MSKYSIRICCNACSSRAHTSAWKAVPFPPMIMIIDLSGLIPAPVPCSASIFFTNLVFLFSVGQRADRLNPIVKSWWRLYRPTRLYSWSGRGNTFYRPWVQFFTFVLIHSTLISAIVIDREYVSDDFNKIKEFVETFMVYAKREILKHGGINIRYYSWANINIRKDFSAVLSIASCTDTWQLYNSLKDDDVLHMAITGTPKNFNYIANK